MSSAVADNSMRLGGVVINRAKGGEIKFHDAKSGQYSRIDRDGYGVVSGTIDHILHRNVVYKFATDYDFTLPGTVVVVASSGAKEGEDTKQSTLDLGVTGPDGTHNRYTTLPGEPVPVTENAPNGAAVAPGISVSHAPLAGVVFTSSLQPSLATLSLGDSDKASEQQETIDAYKRAIDGMLYRHDITVVKTSGAIVIPINLGPLSITIVFELGTLEGYVEASIIGISLGKAKFDLTKGASIGVDVWLAKASVGVTVDSKAIYLEAHASVRFDGSADFGPEAVYHF